MRSDRIMRVDYRLANDGRIIPNVKIIFEKLNYKYYRKIKLKYIESKGRYLGIYPYARFDGETKCDGVICVTADNVDTYFDMLVKYNGFEYTDEKDIFSTASNEKFLKKFNKDITEEI